MHFEQSPVHLLRLVERFKPIHLHSLYPMNQFKQVRRRMLLVVNLVGLAILRQRHNQQA